MPSLPLSVAGLDLSICKVQCTINGYFKQKPTLFANLTANYFKPSYMLLLTCAEDAPESLDVVLLVAAEDPLDLPPADMQI